MPPDARDLFAEGAVIVPSLLMRDGKLLDETVEAMMANSRTPEARAGDVRAQVAANLAGERRFLETLKRHGDGVFEAALEKTLADAERRTEAALRAWPDGEVTHEDVLEDENGDPSIRLRVRVEKRGAKVTLDYAGTAPQRAMPLNCVFGVTLSGAYYALRAVTDPRIPMNDGSFRPIEVRVPEGSLLNPRRPAPVSAGNVETSMRNADLVLGALSRLVPGIVPAQSGGSMNNVMIGGIDTAGRSWAFYETNGCGMGARPQADGLDAIHVHMTNTLNTPIETIERTTPLRITAYEFAPESAGDGRYRGGAGLVRGFALTEGSATVSLLAERHAVRPQGAHGGGDGACGSHLFVERDGTARPIPAKTSVTLRAGEGIVVRSAGGGGYGPPAERADEARASDAAAGIAPAPPAIA